MTTPYNPRIRDLLEAAGLDPALSEQPQADASLARGIHLALALGERLRLDMAAQGALLHYLHRIDAIDQQLRALHAPAAPRQRAGSLDRPAPWHEPHG